MKKQFRLNFSTAYGQLILLVFLPIFVLAIVGGILVLNKTSLAVRTLQQATANNLLAHYQTVANTSSANLLELNQQLYGNPNQNNISTEKTLFLQSTLKTTFQNSIYDKHLQGMAIINENNQILLSIGDIYPNALSQYFHPLMSVKQSPTPLLSQLQDNQNHLFDNSDSTLYGKKLTFIEQFDNPNANIPTLWLVVNVDNEPLQLARYEVILALAITGLFTILLLLLSLNVYSRRWIAPIYEIRLHLQRTNANNLYQPMSVNSSGELNQLQQDLVKTFRRLHTSFQELKNHAEQNEDDLRLAFDEMEMKNISIRNARDAAVSASQTKSAFLANISHELRTPLNSIDGFINLLSRNGGLNAEQDLYVQTIRKSSAHLLALVNDVLDFSKIEAGKLVLDNHELDLYACIYDVVDMLSPLAGEKNLRLAVFFYDDVPRHLVGDALRIKQILTNLVNNAIKFTDTGEVVVRVSLDDDSDDFIHISVKDTGRGISPEQQQALFQSFSQGDPSITRQYGGTGLGLVISKQLSYLMGGQIGFNDNELEQGDSSFNTTNIGSTFWFTLPIRLSNQAQQDLLTHRPMWELPNVLNSQNSSSRLQLLTWIDHTASIQILKGSLRELPIDITTANSLASLLDTLKEMGNRWEWVIVDNATSADTIALLKQIRLHYAGKLALFGYHMNLDNEILTRYQALPLYQPLDKRQLYQLLDTNVQTTPDINQPKWHGFRVLAVDDHLPNLLVLEALLAELGVEVITVNSGFEAIDFMKNQQKHADAAVDLIFMDIQMPRMSGHEASHQIRQIETALFNNHHIPIIALTAHSLSDEREKLLQSGIDDYVGKPISQTQLVQILQRWLGKNSENLSNNPESLGDNITPTPNHIQQKSINTTNNIDNPPLEADSIYHLAVIDWDDALTRVAGKPDLATNLITMLIDSVEQEQTELIKAWQNQDRQLLANIAHRILGASRYTGVPQLRQACQNLEDKCLLNVNNNSPAQLAMLTPFYEQLLQALDNLQTIDLSPWPQLKYAKLKEHDMTWKMI